MAKKNPFAATIFVQVNGIKYGKDRTLVPTQTGCQLTIKDNSGIHKATHYREALELYSSFSPL